MCVSFAWKEYVRRAGRALSQRLVGGLAGRRSRIYPPFPPLPRPFGPPFHPADHPLSRRAQSRGSCRFPGLTLEVSGVNPGVNLRDFWVNPPSFAVNPKVSWVNPRGFRVNPGVNPGVSTGVNPRVNRFPPRLTLPLTRVSQVYPQGFRGNIGVRSFGAKHSPKVYPCG